MNERTQMMDELDAAEGLIAGGQLDYALELFERLTADAEEYVDRNCPTTDEVQWFSFPTPFERLAYRRVESDPRELKDVGEPLDRLYADYALALVSAGDYAGATEALRQAVRWNPMECGYRLDLAELYRTNGDMQEYMGLTFSVFERASDVRHLIRAFCNFTHYFETTQNPRAAAACLRCARRLDYPDNVLDALLKQAAGTETDPDSMSDEEATAALAEQGLPDGANAEVAACLLICATTAAEKGQRDLAATFTVRARDLIGAPAVKALLVAIREANAGEAAVESDSAEAGTSGDAAAASSNGAAQEGEDA